MAMSRVSFRFLCWLRVTNIETSSTDTLQYLDQDDLKRYLGYLTAHQQHYVQDPTYLRVVHAEHLKPVKGDRKKDIR